MLDMIQIRQHNYSTEKSCGYRFHVQYRINKKGAECFRTGSREEAEAKLKELSAKRPGIYTMQKRETRIDRYGQELWPLEKAGWS